MHEMFDVRCLTFDLQPADGAVGLLHNPIFLFARLSEYTHHMPELPPEQVTPFVFSDPSGKRWPRLRLILLLGGVLFFVLLVLFVQTLFVTPKMNVPFSLRQLKGQLRAFQKQNPADQLSPSSLLWQKFAQARQAARKLAGAAPAPSPRKLSAKKSPNNEVRLAFHAHR